jgi:hypothetical protein
MHAEHAEKKNAEALPAYQRVVSLGLWLQDSQGIRALVLLILRRLVPYKYIFLAAAVGDATS